MKVKPPFGFLVIQIGWSDLGMCMLEAVRGTQMGECKAVRLAGAGRRW